MPNPNVTLIIIEATINKDIQYLNKPLLKLRLSYL